MKSQLVFDTTGVFADQDKVGAYVVAAGGDLITSTNDAVNSKERLDVLSVLADAAGNAVSVTAGALDVNIASGITLEVDLTHTDDSVRLGDGTDLVTTTTVGADVGLDVNLINASIEVTATALDIRALDFATDSVDVSGSSVTVSATDLDIRDLTAVSDSVQSWLHDGTGTALTSTLVGSDQALDVNIVASAPLEIEDVALANTAIASGATALATGGTAQDVVASPLADRKYLYLYNDDNQKMFVGQSGVTAATGFPVAPGAYLELRAGAALDIEFVSSKAGHDLRYLELS